MGTRLFERPMIKRLQTSMPGKFGRKTEFEPIMTIDDVPVKSLMEKHGSPLFVISERTIRETFGRAKQAFSTRYPKVQFAWSYKTNYLNAVCNVFHQEGAWAEVVSGFEYEKARNNGVLGSNILFNGPGKSNEDLSRAISESAIIHIDNLDELYAIVEIAKTSKVKPRLTVRINLDSGMYPQWSRFGFNYENGEAWEAINRIMLNKNLLLMGLHTHIGTYIMTAAPYGVAATKLAELAVRIQNKFDYAIKYIDLGGGFASKNTLKGSYMPGSDTCASFDDYAQVISSALINSNILPENLPVLVLETGRALIDDAGFLCGTVIANKQMPDGRRATIIDIGVNILFTSFWYDHKITPAQPFSHYTEDTIIYGPMCMNIDVIRENCSLPPLKRGDHVVVSTVGAYNMTQWMQFIMKRPAVVMIDAKGEDHSIREKETTDIICMPEKMPRHLQQFNAEALGKIQ